MRKKILPKFLFYVGRRGFSSVSGARYCAILAEMERAGNIPVSLTGSAGNFSAFSSD
jgi:hypothetical protein